MENSTLVVLYVKPKTPNWGERQREVVDIEIDQKFICGHSRRRERDYLGIIHVKYVVILGSDITVCALQRRISIES